MYRSMQGALQSLTRRQALGGAMGFAVAGGMATMPGFADASSPAASPSRRPLDLARPRDNIYAFAKTWARSATSRYSAATRACSSP